MSQSTFSAGPQGFLSDGPPVYAEEGAPDEASPSGRGRVLKVVAGVLALVILAGAAWFFLLRGGTAEEAVLPDTVAPAGSSAPAEPVTPIVPAPEVAPPAIDGAVGNDPFKPLIFTAVAPTEETAGTTGEEGTAGTTSEEGTTPATGEAPVPTPTTTAPAPITVLVVDVADDNSQATIRIDTADYIVRLGQVFATYFKALSFQTGSCATLQYGDQALAAPLCENESATVQ